MTKKRSAGCIFKETKTVANQHSQLKYVFLQPIVQMIVLLVVGLLFKVNPNYTSQLSQLVQLFSVDILRAYSTWEIVYYLHSQPPLLNFIASIFVRNFPEDVLEGLFISLMLCILFANILLINIIMNELKIPRWCSWLFVLSPSFFLFHTWYYEPVFSLFFTNLIILALVCSTQKNSCVIYTVGLAGLSLSHSIFQPIVMAIFLLIGAFCIYKNNINKKNITLCILIAAIPMSIAIKNYSLVGMFGTSSWSGCNIAQKWPNKDTWVLYPLQDKVELPSIIGGAKMSDNKPNYNNIDFAKYCIGQLKTIAYEARVPSLLVQYIKNVAHTLVENEAKLSLSSKDHCCGIGGLAWGELDYLADKMISFSNLYGPAVLIINLILPLVVAIIIRNDHNSRAYILFMLIYYYSLLISHMANGQEQERLGFRNSFYLYLCLLYIFSIAVRMKKICLLR